MKTKRNPKGETTAKLTLKIKLNFLDEHWKLNGFSDVKSET